MSRRFLTSLLIPAALLAVSAEFQFARAQNAAITNAPRLRPDLMRRTVTHPAPGSRFDFEMQKRAMLSGHPSLVTVPATGVADPLPVPPSPQPLTQGIGRLAGTAPVPPQALRAPFITKRGPGANTSATGVSQNLVATSASRLPVRVPMPEPLPVRANPIASNSASIASRQVTKNVIHVAAMKPVGLMSSDEDFAKHGRPTLERMAVSSATSVTMVRSAAPVADKVLVEPFRLVLPSESLPLVPAPSDDEPVDVIDFSQPQQLGARSDSAIKHVSAVGTISELALLEFPETNVVEGTSTDEPVATPSQTQTTEATPSESRESQPRVFIPEPARLALPSVPNLPQPSVETVNTSKDVLIAQLEGELSELRSERQRLQQSASVTEQFSAQASATTTVHQAAELQNLVTRVAATLGERRAPAPVQSTTVEHRRFAVADICQTAPLPNNFLATGQKLYCKGLIADAEVAFRTASQQAETSYERLLATYLVATCLRRQDKWDDAMQLYNFVATQKEEPTLASLARWQISHSDVRRTTPAPRR